VTTQGEITPGQGPAEPWRGRWHDYYALLGVPRTASSEAIRRAHEERSRQVDPASYADAPPEVRLRAQEEFDLLQQAINVLGDGDLRRLYDEEFDRLSAFRAAASPTAEQSTTAADAALQAPPPWATTRPPEVSGADVLAGRVWGLRDVLIGFGLSGLALIIVGTTFVGGAMAVTGEDEGTAIVAAGVIGTLVFDLVLVGIVYLLILQRYNLSWEAFGFRSVGRQWWVPPVAALGILIVNGIYTATVHALGLEALAPEQELDDLFDTRALLPIIGLFTLITAPIAEEIFFRGFIFPGLIGRLGVWGAALASGLFFGAVHISSVDTIGLVIPLGAIGVFLALLYARTGSLWINIGTHFCINLVAFVALASGAGS
jgi:membrane protease YdiL (CAAX protease family)